MKIVNGTGIGTKKSRGKLRFLRNEKVGVSNYFTTYENEMNRLKKSIEAVKKSLKELEKIAKAKMGSEEAKIFEIHGMLLEDDDLYEATEYEISQGKSYINQTLIAIS